MLRCGQQVVDACSKGKVDELRKLIANNIYLFTSQMLFDTRDPEFNMNYKYQKDYTAMHAAAYNGNLECVNVLLEFNASPDAVDAGTATLKCVPIGTANVPFRRIYPFALCGQVGQ